MPGVIPTVLRSSGIRIGGPSAQVWSISRKCRTKARDTRIFDQYQFDEEIEERHHLFGRDRAVRLLGYLSHGRMGDYNDATSIALQTGQPANIAGVRSTHNRGGFSLNAEQALADDLGMFARAGWSQGGYENFDYTDIDKKAGCRLKEYAGTGPTMLSVLRAR